MKSVAVLAAVLLGCAPVIDAQIPPGYQALVESARGNVLGNYEGLFRPGLAMTQIRCFANGGVVVLFRQVGGRTPGEPAFAMQGPGAVADAWAGGYGALAEIDAEIEFNFGHVPEVACPPRAG